MKFEDIAGGTDRRAVKLGELPEPCASAEECAELHLSIGAEHAAWYVGRFVHYSLSTAIENENLVSAEHELATVMLQRLCDAFPPLMNQLSRLHQPEDNAVFRMLAVVINAAFVAGFSCDTGSESVTNFVVREKLRVNGRKGGLRQKLEKGDPELSATLVHLRQKNPMLSKEDLATRVVNKLPESVLPTHGAIVKKILRMEKAGTLPRRRY